MLTLVSTSLALKRRYSHSARRKRPAYQHDVDADTAGEARDEMGVGVVRQAVAYRSDIGQRRNSRAGVHIVNPHIGSAIDIRLPQREADKSIRQEIADGVCGPRPQRAVVGELHRGARRDSSRRHVIGRVHERTSLTAAVGSEEIAVGIVQLNTDDGLAELIIVADEPAKAAVLHMGFAEQGPLGDVELRLQVDVVQELFEQVLAGVGEVHVRPAVGSVATDIGAPPIDVGCAQPLGEAAAKKGQVRHISRLRATYHSAHHSHQQQSTHRNAPSHTLNLVMIIAC